MSITASIPAPFLDGQFVPATSAKLSNPSGTFGVRRADTFEVIVPDGTNMTLVGGDTYEYEFTSVEDVPYEIWYELVIDGETYYSSNTTMEGDGPEPTTRELRFVCVKDDEYINFGSEFPTLASPSAGYGVKCIDTGEVLLPSGSTMGDEDEYVYKRGFELPDNGNDFKYKFYVRAIINDRVWFVPSTTASVNSTMLAIGRYTDSLEIGKRFGIDNMHLWLSSFMDKNEEPVDYALRAYQFIADAEQEIDDRLKGAYVAGPFGVDGEGNPITVPPIITQLATVIAGVKMYEARGVDDVDPVTNEPFHRLRYEKREAEKRIKQIAMGLLKVTGATQVLDFPYVQQSNCTIYSPEAERASDDPFKIA